MKFPKIDNTSKLPMVLTFIVMLGVTITLIYIFDVILPAVVHGGDFVMRLVVLLPWLYGVNKFIGWVWGGVTGFGRMLDSFDAQIEEEYNRIREISGKGDNAHDRN